MSHLGPLAVFLGMIGLSFVGPAALAETPAVWWSTASAAILIGLLTILSVSVLYSGIGKARSIWLVLVIATTGMLATIGHFAVLYRWLGIRDSSGAVSASYSEAFYFSVVTWTTLGYGDFVPIGLSRWVVIIQVLSGYVLMALFIAALVRIISDPKR